MGAQVPAEGEVRFMTITDRQFGRIRVFAGKKRQPTPPSPAQLEFF
jgi:CRISPR-associated protein Cas2